MIDRLLISAGAMKAGTSWLYKLLEQHPSIETTPVKEIHYFAHLHTPLKFLDDNARVHNLRVFAQHHDLSADLPATAADLAFFSRYLRTPINDLWYSSLFQNNTKPYKADFSNMACILDGSAHQHMRRICDHVKVLYTLRDPFDRLWSHVKFHTMIMGESNLLDSLSVEGFIEYLEISGAAAQSEYCGNLQRMRQTFPNEELGIFYFEDFVEKPQASLNGICNFLNLPRHTFLEEDLRAVHNPGPIHRRPKSFIEAAKRLLNPQLDALSRSDIGVHKAWNVDSDRWDKHPEPFDFDTAEKRDAESKDADESNEARRSRQEEVFRLSGGFSERVWPSDQP